MKNGRKGSLIQELCTIQECWDGSYQPDRINTVYLVLIYAII